MSDYPVPACEAACIRLCLDFVDGIDAGNHDRCASSFSLNAVFDHITGRIEGRDAVKRMLASRPAGLVTRHMCTTMDIEPIGPTKARGRCYVAVFRATSEDGKLPLPPVKPLFVEYHDEYDFIDGRWYITYRKTVPIFA
jgi:hypothetical protein